MSTCLNIWWDMWFSTHGWFYESLHNGLREIPQNQFGRKLCLRGTGFVGSFFFSSSHSSTNCIHVYECSLLYLVLLWDWKGRYALLVIFSTVNISFSMNHIVKIPRITTWSNSLYSSQFTIIMAVHAIDAYFQLHLQQQHVKDVLTVVS